MEQNELDSTTIFGANEEVIKIPMEIGELKNKEKIMGFGHRVYKI